MNNSQQIINFIKDYFGSDFVHLHRPVFNGNEKKYLIQCIDSNFVSSAGDGIIEFENKIAKFVGSKYSVAIVNGTSALHIALKLSNVKPDNEVITQALTFVATCNAISYVGAHPIFIDVDKKTMGLSPDALALFLDNNAKIDKKGKTINKLTGNVIAACVPMHTFGHPCRMEEISYICNKFHIPLIEDAAESLGSKYKNKHTGMFGLCGVTSFNGNKIITTGGGGMIFTDDKDFALLCKHITTTAKKDHKYSYNHDQIGYNYRMPNLNAMLGLAQIERIDYFIKEKRKNAKIYEQYFENIGIVCFKEPTHSYSNYWLNCILIDSINDKLQFLEEANSQGVMARPIWTLMNDLEMFKDCQTDDLKNSKWLEQRVVCIPSSVK